MRLLKCKCGKQPIITGCNGGYSYAVGCNHCKKWFVNDSKEDAIKDWNNEHLIEIVIEMENEKEKVVCGNCLNLREKIFVNKPTSAFTLLDCRRKYSCIAPENMRMVIKCDWLKKDIIMKSVLQPSTLNKNNDCGWFIEKV